MSLGMLGTLKANLFCNKAAQYSSELYITAKCFGEHYNGKVFGNTHGDNSNIVDDGHWKPKVQHPNMLIEADNQTILAEESKGYNDFVRKRRYTQRYYSTGPIRRSNVAKRYFSADPDAGDLSHIPDMSEMIINMVPSSSFNLQNERPKAKDITATFYEQATRFSDSHIGTKTRPSKTDFTPINDRHRQVLESEHFGLNIDKMVQLR